MVLLLFFLLYFSPIFFFKSAKNPENNEIKNLFSFELSPQKSLIIPLVLTYLGIYILAFTFSGSIAESLHTHLLILLAIFCIFLGYMFSFHWKHPVFFDVLGFHLVFSYITLILIAIYYFFFRDAISWIDAVFTLVTMGFSIFFFENDEKNRREFFYPFLVSLFFAVVTVVLFVIPKISLTWLL